ncbi:hypothetical protein JKI95_03110 [Corynebacterium aquatimens]|uniref:exonuclease domain-containing protein n=1 Tax=Corynebacterium aquatimens TaxID=1190508 RepID=UPI002540CCEE|nr:exonuclease domain-containing protein [Corynebacterium aquatimens]QYH20034.1 hypothetical protein JKI95_03110 [Corynebacterium aquatimens]
MALIDALRQYLDGNTVTVDKQHAPVVPQPARGRPAAYIPPLPRLMRDEFVAVDFETANRVGGASACQVAMVKVRGGDVVDQFCTYLRPPEEHIAFEFSHIHGIYRGDVEDAPSWFDIADDVVEFVGTRPCTRTTPRLMRQCGAGWTATFSPAPSRGSSIAPPGWRAA